MSDRIKVPCRHNCSVEGNQLRIGVAIAAHRVGWYEGPEDEYLLNATPVVGQQYVVSLQGPYYITLHESLWLYYEPPLVFYNGYDSEGSDADGCRFCQGFPTQVVRQTDDSIEVWFQVDKVVTLRDCMDQYEDQPFLPDWEDFFRSSGHAAAGYTYIKRLGEYLFLSRTTEQSYMGTGCLVMLREGRYFACMFREWEACSDHIYGGKYLLSEGFVQWLMDEAEVRYRIYIDGNLFVSLRDSSHYDTATPYQWCAGKLKEVYAAIVRDEGAVRIKAKDRCATPMNKEDFIAWLVHDFRGGFEDIIK